MPKNNQHELSDEAIIAEMVDSASPKHISETLKRDAYTVYEGIENDANPVTAALVAIEEGRQNFARYMSVIHNLKISPQDSTSWMRGIAMMSGFALDQASAILKYRRPTIDALGKEHETKLGWSSEDKLTTVCVELLKVLVVFYQATRYTHAIQTSQNDTDPFPSLFTSQDDAVLKPLFDALKAEIPEYAAGIAPKNTGN